MCASEQQRRASTPCIQAGDQHRRLERPDTFFASPLCCFTAHRTLVSFVYVLFCGGFQAGPAWAILRLCSCCGLRAYIGGVRRADGKRVRKRASFLREGHRTKQAESKREVRTGPRRRPCGRDALSFAHAGFLPSGRRRFRGPSFSSHLRYF